MDTAWDRLERRHILVDPRVGAALRDVPVTEFLAPEMRSISPLDAPLPTTLAEPRTILPAPRYLAMLLQMLELEKGVSVLLLGSAGGYVEALVARLVRPATVTVLEEDANLASAAKLALEAQGLATHVAFVSSPPPDARFDRVATTDAIQRLTPTARDAIADMGFAVFRRYHEAFGFVKVLRSGDEFVELSTTDLGAPMRADGGAGLRTPPVDVGRELLLARMLENVWQGRPETEHERQFVAVVDDTYAKPEARPPMAAAELARYEAAKRLFQIGYIYQSAGDWEASVDAYAASIAVRPTAEAHTFLGWVYSFQDRHQEAIAECEKAIAVDPSFGNPYNDIGAYLIELERLDEAIPWFEKAKKAVRYCCYFYAYSNLGRVYMMKGMHEKARREFQEALRINAQYDYAREMLRRLDRGSAYLR
jgi:protein-L-isoaspartate O-methyltransferase/Tfp pilus assembly protein PilF